MLFLAKNNKNDVSGESQPSEKRITHDFSQRKSKMAGWWHWTLVAVFWMALNIVHAIIGLSSGPKYNGLIMLPGTIIIFLRFTLPPPTYGRSFLLLIGCFMTIMPMMSLILSVPFNSSTIVISIFAIALILAGFKTKTS